jgi:hypothetical protein
MFPEGSRGIWRNTAAAEGARFPSVRSVCPDRGHDAISHSCVARQICRSGAPIAAGYRLLPRHGTGTMTSMRRILPAGLLVLLVAAPAVAQPSTIRPGDIRCPDCAMSGYELLSGWPA